MKYSRLYFLACVLIFLQAAVVKSEVAGFHDRKLLAQPGCPAGCRADKCFLDGTGERMLCKRCVPGLVVVKSSDRTIHGQCSCKQGRFYSATSGTVVDVKGNRPMCILCTKGNFCPGGVVPSAAVEVACSTINAGLTTFTRGVQSKWGCREMPGWGYTVSDGQPTATKCFGDTYNSGGGKTGCQACPAGFGIDDDAKRSNPVASKHDNITDCLVPPGYYQRSPSEAAPCPQGEYQDRYNRAAKCIPCPVGTTTRPNRVNTAIDFCNTLKPGYFTTAVATVRSPLTSIDTGSTVYIPQDALPCPQNHWCPGGQPTAAYTSLAAPPAADTKVWRCTSGNGLVAGNDTNPLWTKGQGAETRDECLVPPGHGLVNGALVQCASGFYRESWISAVTANRPSCVDCADDNGSVTSQGAETLVVYPNLDNAETTTVQVIGSSSSCRLKPGYGMYQTPSGFRALACAVNSYGSADFAYGVGVSPCRQCPTNMVTGPLASANPSVKNNDGDGFTSALACQTRPGYGWDGRVSTECPVGTYNPGGNRDECKPCPWGHTTVDNPAQQINETNCLVAPGYEKSADGVVQECPVGTYSGELKVAGESCKACADNTYTFDTGSMAATDCSACRPGFGKSRDAPYDAPCLDCSGTEDDSGTPPPAAYGPVARDNTECVPCPVQTTGFTFFHLGETKPFTSEPIIKYGQTSAASCVSRYAQIESGLWFLRGADINVTSSGGFPVTTFEHCVSACTNWIVTGTKRCMFLTWDYAPSNQACTVRLIQPRGPYDELLAFKALPSGDVMGAGASSEGAANPKAVASGMYTQWNVSTANAEAIGTTGPEVIQNINPKTKGECMGACDMDASCAAVRIVGAFRNDPATQAISSCRFVYGESNPSTLSASGRIGARSLTHAVLDRLT